MMAVNASSASDFKSFQSSSNLFSKNQCLKCHRLLKSVSPATHNSQLGDPTFKKLEDIDHEATWRNEEMIGGSGDWGH